MSDLFFRNLLIILVLIPLAGFSLTESPLPGFQPTGTFPPAAKDSVLIISEITFSGNRTTKENILKRELPFEAGDTILLSDFPGMVGKSRDNLLNTSLFNFVYADTVISAGSPPKASITYRFVERWYLWPFPVIKLADRNINTWLQHGDADRFTYGFYLQKDNFRGRREKLVLSWITGYDRAFGFIYEVPYLTRKQHLGLSFSTQYVKNHSVPYDSYNNKLVEIKDKRLFLKTSLISSLRLSYRNGIHFYHFLTVTRSRYDFTDTLLILNPNYSFPGNRHPEFFSISYRFKADFRDYQPYPLTGHFFDIELTKDGLDLTGNDKPNQLTARASARKYWEVVPRLNLAAGITVKRTLENNLPFFMTKGLGYENDLVRGYEYYVIDGQDYFLVRTDLKWNLLRQKVGNIKALPPSIGLIHCRVYLTVFTDAGWVHTNRLDNLNMLADRWLLGTGVGLNVVTYYDKVFRLEVSHNQKAETGVFLNFVAPI
ncbi:MAG: BamA/TamA family outer membrane protein [Bacteroidetes bacterium]|nr:BamA/TamA family outer membrane protein [Bacteroidota bacterium]